MKCPPFDYVRPGSVEEVVAALAAADGEGKILAGGQSLVPVLALRMARPEVLVDVNKVPQLSDITPDGGAKDVFVHISAIEASGLRTLVDGQKVTFDVEPDRMGKGPKAVNLRAA